MWCFMPQNSEQKFSLMKRQNDNFIPGHVIEGNKSLEVKRDLRL